MIAAPHPINFDTLQKGSVIHPDDVAQATDCEVGSTAYGLAAMGLCKRIEDDLLSRGMPVTVIIRSGAIHVLSDEEASEYNRRAFYKRLAGMARDHTRMQRVDVGQLSELARAKHEEQLLSQAKYIAGVRQVRSELRLAPVAKEDPRRLE